MIRTTKTPKKIVGAMTFKKINLVLPLEMGKNHLLID
jgi:hypothetical protein